MDFLESLYEIENFGIYLFVVIGILVVLFLVVLFFGKRDQKMRQKLEEPEIEQPESKEEFAFHDDSKGTDVSVTPNMETPETINTPVMEPELPKEDTVPTPVFENHPTTNVVLNNDLDMEEQPIPEPVQESESASATKEFDFDALAEAISKELESIDNSSKSEPEKEEYIKPQETTMPEDNNFQVFEPIRIEEPEKVQEAPRPVVEEKKEEVKPRPVMPTVFSSVYVNREKEEQKKEEPKAEPEMSRPARPTIDLPKIADLPKRAEEQKTEPIIESQEEDDGIIFK